MDCCFIISRFSEDLTWVRTLEPHKVIIYNKGDAISEEEYKNIVNLKNVGRESHTWLYHIVNNYHNLSEANIFLQGRIDDLGCMSFKDPLDYLENINKYGFSVSRYGLLGPTHWKDNIGIEKDLRYKQKWESGEISRSLIGFRKFAKNLFPNIPLLIATSYGGCFAVKRENIIKNDLSFYVDLLQILEQNKNPIEGHYMERLWCYIFTQNKPLLTSFRDVIKTKFENLDLVIRKQFFFNKVI